MSLYTLSVGKIGETLAIDYLKRHSFEIIGKNIYERDGELDIVAKKEEVYHMVEVKARSKRKNEKNTDVLPEEAVTLSKLKKIVATAKKYFINNNIDINNINWQVDVISVIMDWEKRKANVKYFPSIQID